MLAFQLQIGFSYLVLDASAGKGSTEPLRHVLASIRELFSCQVARSEQGCKPSRRAEEDTIFHPKKDAMSWIMRALTAYTKAPPASRTAKFVGNDGTCFLDHCLLIDSKGVCSARRTASHNRTSWEQDQTSKASNKYESKLFPMNYVSEIIIVNVKICPIARLGQRLK